MTLLQDNGRPTPTLTALVFLSVLMIGRLILQIRLYQQGFISTSADEFARGLRTLTWSQNPRLSPAADLISPWPPFEMYLNGLMLRVIDDVLIAPRLTVFVASCLLLIALFLLVAHLFNGSTATLAVTLVAVHPWTVWLSGTPMLEMYFLACFLGGLYFITVWLCRRQRFYWLVAGLLFFLASGLHVQSWILINLVNLFTLIYWYQFIRQKAYKQVARLIGFWLLGNAYIIFWAIAEYAMTGQLFGILASHTTYSLWFYDGYNVDIIEKLLYFPRIVWRNIPLLVWLLSGVGLFFVLRGPARIRRLYPLVLGGLVLLIASIFNLASGPPSAAPDRYVLLYVLLLSPYAAYGIFRLGERAWQIGNRPLAYLATAIIAALFSGVLAQGLVQTAVFPQGMAQDTIKTGRYLQQALIEPGVTQPPFQPAETVLVEALYWDFLALELLTRQDARIIYDREHDYLNRDNPSIFEEDTAVVHSHLLQASVGLVALRDPLLQEQARTLPFLAAQQEIGDWVIFRFINSPP
ncbi:MAG: hypothetical protein R6X32_05175 [Chloroflexota bacterium]